MLRWTEVEPYEVRGFRFEFGIRRAHVPLEPMGLQARVAPRSCAARRVSAPTSAGAVPRPGQDARLRGRGHQWVPRARWRRSRLASPSASNRPFRSAIVRELHPLVVVMLAYGSPTANCRTPRARRAASARTRLDRTWASSSARWSVVNTSPVNGMNHGTLHPSSVQDTQLVGDMDLIRFGGHLPRGRYDVHNGRNERSTHASPVHG